MPDTSFSLDGTLPLVRGQNKKSGMRAGHGGGCLAVLESDEPGLTAGPWPPSTTSPGMGDFSSPSSHGYLLHQGHGVDGGRLVDSWLSTLLPDPCLVLSLCGPTVSRCWFLEWQSSAGNGAWWGDCLSWRLRRGLSGQAAYGDSGDPVLTSACVTLGRQRLSPWMPPGRQYCSRHFKHITSPSDGRSGREQSPQSQAIDCFLHGFCQYLRTACSISCLICILNRFTFFPLSLSLGDICEIIALKCFNFCSVLHIKVSL